MSNESGVEAARAIGKAIRLAREAHGVSQGHFSKQAGCSRSTIHHIENFDGNQDVGFLKFSAAARAAGVLLLFSPGGQNPDVLERRLERERAAVRNAAVREKHYRIAAELAVGDGQALKRLEDARRIVRLWRENGACSPEYIDAWSENLDGNPGQVAKRILSIESGWVNAMFQNTPFSLQEAFAGE